ncbi:MAG: hypothetical protein EKK29_20630 [Hyphomicrobiales bacterium]|nr:MAG: hypothetical protein EKK29_20630 [Hyphomicrobiales bacterium]
MPWQPEDAPRYTHKADTLHLCRLWAEVANSVLAETGDEGRAVRSANAAVSKERRRWTNEIMPGRNIGKAGFDR